MNGDNLFDNIKGPAYNIVTNTMGYDAVWVPSNNLLPTINARVLFKDTSEVIKLGFADFITPYPIVEYKLIDIPGLKESVDASVDEEITINSVVYYVRLVKTLADGEQALAFLNK